MGEENENQELPDIEESVADAVEEKPLERATSSATSNDLGLIMEVPLHLSVELGSANLPVREVLALEEGSVVELDRMESEPADIYVNDRLIARGELDVKDDRVAVRITELLSGRAGKENS